MTTRADTLQCAKQPATQWKGTAMAPEDPPEERPGGHTLSARRPPQMATSSATSRRASLRPHAAGARPPLACHLLLRSIDEIAELVAADSVSPREAVLIANRRRWGTARVRSSPPRPERFDRGMAGLRERPGGHPRSRGARVAQALLAAGEAWAREQGFRHLALDTFGANGRARALYARWASPRKR
jgi:GNAT superfamily N-acetyltransferase